MPAARHTQAERTAALELYKSHGSTEAARQTGIAPGTIRQWAHRNGICNAVTPNAPYEAAINAARITWQERRTALRDASGEAAVRFLDRAKSARKGADARAFAQAFAIAVDRAALLAGDATQRIEASDGFDREAARLLGEYESRNGTAVPAG